MSENIKKYPNISESIKSVYVKNNLEFKKNMEIKAMQSKMIANLINVYINVDNIVEFGDIVYLDENNITPSIAKEFANNNRTATIVTPRTKKEGKLGNLSIINTTFDNPFGNYQEVITPSSSGLIKDAKCFVVTEELPNLDKHFRAWAGIGVPCVYAIAGTLNKDIKQTDEKVREKMLRMKTQFIDVDSNFSYDYETNTMAKIYILKR